LGTREVEQSINADKKIKKVDMGIFPEEKYTIPKRHINKLNFNNRCPISLISKETLNYYKKNN